MMSDPIMEMARETRERLERTERRYNERLRELERVYEENERLRVQIEEILAGRSS